jgi:hypothetical protein
MTRHPVLHPGDMLRLGGQTHTVAGLDSATVRLADVTGMVTEVPTAGLLADPSLELITASRVRMAPQPALERLPAEAVETARLWAGCGSHPRHRHRPGPAHHRLGRHLDLPANRPPRRSHHALTVNVAEQKRPWSEVA